MDTENSMAKAGGRGWMEGAEGREMGNICNSVNQKKSIKYNKLI